MIARTLAMARTSYGTPLLLVVLSFAGARAENAPGGALPKVATARVKEGTVEHRVRAVAELRAYERVRVFARITGYAKAVRADLGDRVEAGQVLCELEAPELEAEVLGARAALERAKAEVERAQAQQSLKKTLYEVTRALFDKNARNRLDLETAEGELELAQAELKVAEARLEEAEARLRGAEALFGFREVRAPFGGIVTRRLVDTGALVESRSGGDAGPLFEVQRIDRLRVRLEIPEVDAAAVLEAAARNALRIRLEFPGWVRDLSGEEPSGWTIRFARELHPQSHHMLAEIHLPNPEERLLPGYFGKARILVPPLDKGGVLVPNEALQAPPGGRPFVFRIRREDDRAYAEVVRIETGPTDGTWTEVRSGLKPGDEVVVRGAGILTGGQEVEIPEAKTAKEER